MEISLCIQKVLPILLRDNTTNRNVIWATSTGAETEMQVSDVTTIQPRVMKSQLEQKNRTKGKAEVFTPSWLCNDMNNHCDEVWFGRTDVFNKPGEKEHSWISTDVVVFPNEPGKTWMDYVLSMRLEITCGEAPYLVSRYDTTTGKIIPVSERIGILDRKLRVVNENADTYNDWLLWTFNAYRSTYGYEYQGDNLLIARINMLETFVDNMVARWNVEPCAHELMLIAHIISWNIWQMDGLTNQVPMSDEYCIIRDWSSGNEIVFNTLMEVDDNGKTRTKKKSKNAGK